MATLREGLVQLLVDRGVDPLRAADTVNDVVKEIQAGLELAIARTRLVQLHDLSGFEVAGGMDNYYGAVLTHRCGWELDLDDGHRHLAGLAEKAVEHRWSGCRLDS